MSDTRIFEIYRYDPDVDKAPRMETYELELHGERMLLDALISLKKVDESISYRRSCREGVCGSDAMNINGKNGLACLTNMRSLPKKITLRPLPGLPVVRDLIVDMTLFFKQYLSIKPYLINETPPPVLLSARSWMVYMSASYVLHAQPPAHRSGGTPINLWDPQDSCKPIALLLTAVIRQLVSVWIISRTRIVCSVVTPS